MRISTRRVSAGLLAAAVVSGSISVIPALPFVAVAAAAYLVGLVLVYRHGIPSRRVVKWYVLYVVLSYVYAVVIGVDTFDWVVYRRELKYFIPFSTFVVFSLLKYPDEADRLVVRTLLVVGWANVFLLLASPLLAQVDLSALYVDDGGIWDVYESSLIYLGAFRSHSGAGGSFAAMALTLLGVSRAGGIGRRTRLVAGGLSVFFLVLLALSRSRAYALASGLVVAHTLVSGKLRKRVYLVAYASLFMLVSPFAIGFAQSRISTYDLLTLGDTTLDLSDYNVLSRYVLWAKALENFAESPIIGVGMTRFDDEMMVVATFPQEREELLDVKVFPSYAEWGPVRVNVDPAQAHTDQSAHNMYLHVLGEGGVLFMALLGTLILSTIRRLREVARQAHGPRAGLAQGVLYSLYAVLLASAFGNSYLTVTPMFVLLSVAGYLNAVGAVEREVTR